MHHWTLYIIIYERDGRFEAEAINAAIAGVGTTHLDAMRSFEQMAESLAMAAVETGARLTYDPEPDELALFGALDSGTLPEHEIAARKIVGLGTLGLGLHKVHAGSKARVEHAKLELVAGAA
jgi:hypothetical protein